MNHLEYNLREITGRPDCLSDRSMSSGSGGYDATGSAGSTTDSVVERLKALANERNVQRQLEEDTLRIASEANSTTTVSDMATKRSLRGV